MEKVINLVIQQTEILIQRVNKLEFITETYHEYKNEKESFIKYLNKKLEKDAKDRDSSGIPDDKRQEVPKRKGSDKGRGDTGKNKTSKKKQEG